VFARAGAHLLVRFKHHEPWWKLNISSAQRGKRYCRRQPACIFEVQRWGLYVTCDEARAREGNHSCLVSQVPSFVSELLTCWPLSRITNSYVVTDSVFLCVCSAYEIKARFRSRSRICTRTNIALKW